MGTRLITAWPYTQPILPHWILWELLSKYTCCVFEGKVKKMYNKTNKQTSEIRHELKKWWLYVNEYLKEIHL